MRLSLSVSAVIIFLSISTIMISKANAQIPIDGSPFGASTGNISVEFIKRSPIGAAPESGFFEEPPSPESLQALKRDALAGYEDYVAWGAIERSEGKWDWTQHDKVQKRLSEAGLDYIVYPWLMVPPTWLQGTERLSLMTCAEHNQTSPFVNIWDKRSIEWYERFYKALREHFKDKLKSTYACILGPYGEGNYPLPHSGPYVNIGHCHEGWWCAGADAAESFSSFTKHKFRSVQKMNKAWGTTFDRFEDVVIPHRCRAGGHPTPEDISTPQSRAYWLDFMWWFNDSLTNFAGESIKAALKYFPKEKLQAKPGGSAGGMNPIHWGTYCPLFAKMAGKYGVTLQPADCHGAYFADKWVATAYRYYGVRLATEPAGSMDTNGQIRRMFSDASCGASEFFSYEWEKHRQAIRRYIHLYTGSTGAPRIALMYPTTDWQLGRDVWPAVRAADALRDAADYDVLDELLIADGALGDKYKALVILQGEHVDGKTLKKIRSWARRGGLLITGPNVKLTDARSAAGDALKQKDAPRWVAITDTKQTPLDLAKAVAKELTQAGIPLVDGKFDDVWTTIREGQKLTLDMTHPDFIISETKADVDENPKNSASQPKLITSK